MKGNGGIVPVVALKMRKDSLYLKEVCATVTVVFGSPECHTAIMVEADRISKGKRSSYEDRAHLSFLQGEESRPRRLYVGGAVILLQ
jgi:hypothetical protein